MPRNTKNKIVRVSINLFNELGLANVRLQQIADEAGISVGNLAYHFKNKEAIVSQVYEQLFADFSAILALYLRTPDLSDFDALLARYFHFFQQYRFYLAELMTSPGHDKTPVHTWNEYANKLHAQIRQRINFYVESHQLIPEPQSGLYDQLATNVWRSIFFSIPEAIFRGHPLSEAAFRREVWTQLAPYLTETGAREFQTLSVQN